jgi:hypothetical protein
VIKANLTKLVPSGLADWAAFVVPKLGKTTKKWAKLIKDGTSINTFAEMLKTDERLRIEDEHNAEMINAMLDGSAQRVTNL